jgi:hypothetical protein
VVFSPIVEERSFESLEGHTCVLSETLSHRVIWVDCDVIDTLDGGMQDKEVILGVD